MYEKGYLPSYLFTERDGKVTKVLFFDVEQNTESTIVSYHMRRDRGKPMRNVSGCLCLPAVMNDYDEFRSLMDFRWDVIKRFQEVPK